MNINKITQVGLLLSLLIFEPIKAGKNGEGSSSAAASIDNGEGTSSAVPVKIISINVINSLDIDIFIQNFLEVDGFSIADEFVKLPIRKSKKFRNLRYLQPRPMRYLMATFCHIIPKEEYMSKQFKWRDAYGFIDLNSIEDLGSGTIEILSTSEWRFIKKGKDVKNAEIHDFRSPKSGYGYDFIKEKSTKYPTALYFKIDLTK